MNQNWASPHSLVGTLEHVYTSSRENGQGPAERPREKGLAGKIQVLGDLQEEVVLELRLEERVRICEVSGRGLGTGVLGGERWPHRGKKGKREAARIWCLAGQHLGRTRGPQCRGRCEATCTKPVTVETPVTSTVHSPPEGEVAPAIRPAQAVLSRQWGTSQKQRTAQISGPGTAVTAGPL